MTGTLENKIAMVTTEARHTDRAVAEHSMASKDSEVKNRAIEPNPTR